MMSGRNLTTATVNGIHQQSNKVDNQHHSNDALKHQQIVKGSLFVENQVKAGGKDSKGFKGGKRANGSEEDKSTFSPGKQFLHSTLFSLMFTFHQFLMGKIV